MPLVRSHITARLKTASHCLTDSISLQMGIVYDVYNCLSGPWPIIHALASPENKDRTHPKHSSGTQHKILGTPHTSANLALLGATLTAIKNIVESTP